LGFSTVFLGTLIAGVLAIGLATRLVKFAKIQWFDRLLGAGFGFIRGWVLGSIVFLVLTSFGLQSERVKSSQLAPYFLPGARVIALAAPYDLKARFMVGYRAVESWWREHS
jgi:membrane protein required for colicin V production